jgi:hypothetical protein
MGSLHRERERERERERSIIMLRKEKIRDMNPKPELKDPKNQTI